MSEKDFQPNSSTVDELSYELIEPEERMELVDTGPISTTNRLAQADEEMPEEDVTDEMLLEDVSAAESWLTNNKGLESTGFSPASRLTPENVDGLERQYELEMEVPGSGSCGGGGLEFSPVVVPGDPPVLYMTQSNQVVRALNARNGEEYWSFQWGVDEGAVPNGNRGVAVWGDKVYVGTTTVDVVALDRYTGEQVWETKLITDEQYETWPDIEERIEVTEAPIAYDGKIYVAQSGDASFRGELFALDAESGDVIWNFNAAPEGEWVGDSWQHANATGWNSPAVDPESDTVFWSIANPIPWFNPTFRPGPNRHTNSVAAVDAQSGEVRWFNQTLPTDCWDYDTHVTPTVFDVEYRGEERRVVSVDPKQGWTYVVDVETGETLRRSDAWTRQDGTFLQLPPFGEENAEPLWPTISGGTEWPPDAYSPETGLRYIGTMDAGQMIFYNDEYDPADIGDYTSGGFGGGVEEEFTAQVRAVDLATGEIVWEHQYEDVDPEMSSPWPGGTTATAGGLVFGASTGGSMVALDAETGDELWSDDTGNRITANPVVWDDPDDGRQYLAVAADDTVVVWAGEGEAANGDSGNGEAENGEGEE